MSLDNLDLMNSLISGEGFGALLNVLVIFLELIYVLYAFLMVRTVGILNRVFHTIPSPLFVMISIIHLALSIGLVYISLLSF